MKEELGAVLECYMIPSDLENRIELLGNSTVELVAERDAKS